MCIRAWSSSVKEKDCQGCPSRCGQCDPDMHHPASDHRKLSPAREVWETPECFPEELSIATANRWLRA